MCSGGNNRQKKSPQRLAEGVITLNVEGLMFKESFDYKINDYNAKKYEYGHA